MYRIFSKNKTLYIFMMIFSFICFNVENVQATEASASIPMQILPSADGTNHLSDDTGNPPMLDDIVKIGTFFEHLKNDYVDIKNQINAKKKEEIIGLSLKVSTKILGAYNDFQNFAEDVNQMEVSEVMDGLVATNVLGRYNTDTVVTRQMKGELSAKDKQAIQELQEKLSYDESSKTWTVGTKTGANPYDLLTGEVSPYAEQLFRDYNSEIYYAVQQAKLTRDLFKGGIKVNSVLSAPAFFKKYNISYYALKPEYLYICTKVKHKISGINKFIVWRTRFKWGNYQYKYYLLPSFNNGDLIMSCVLYDNVNKSFKSENGNKIIYNLVNDFESSVFIFNGDGSYDTWLNGVYGIFNDYKILDFGTSFISLAGLSMKNSAEYFYRLEDNELIKVSDEEFFNALDLVQENSLIYNPTPTKRPVVIPNLDINDTVVVPLEDEEENAITLDLEGLKQNTAQVKPDVYNPTYNYTTINNIDNSITNEFDANSFIGKFFKALDKYLKNIFTINWKAIKDPYNAFKKKLKDKMPFVPQTLQFFETIRELDRRIQKPPEDYRPVFKIHLSGIFGNQTVVFTDLDYFHEHRYLIHRWVTLGGWLYVIMSCLKRAPLIFKE